MARPRIPVGGHGAIRCREQAAGHVADTWFRGRDGKLRRVERSGRSKTAATTNLQKALTRLVDEVRGGQITGDTRVAHVAQLWLATVERKVRTGTLGPRTSYSYDETWRNHLKPRLGELTCRELEDDVAVCDETIQNVQENTGTPTARIAKTVLNQICAHAVRNKAMTTNPAANVQRLERRGGQRKEIRALAVEQRADFLAKLTAWIEERVKSSPRLKGVRGRAWTDLPEVTVGQLATGGRIGEVLAVDADDVDAAARMVTLSHHLVRIKGEGIVRVPGRKGDEPPVTVKVPSWSVPMWRKRVLASGGGPLFPTWNGSWHDPSNVAKRLAEACKEIGYPWVTSHAFRRTVGTHLGQSNLSNEQIGDQLGNTAPMVQAHYRAPKVANEAIAEVLESMFDVPDETSDVDTEEGAG